MLTSLRDRKNRRRVFYATLKSVKKIPEEFEIFSNKCRIFALVLSSQPSLSRV
jgi:hypothetical protein